MQVDIKYITYAATGVCIFGAISPLIMGVSGWYAVFAAILCFSGAVVAVSVFKYGYVILPFFTRQGNIVQIMEGNYEIPPSQDVILKNVGGLYYASAYLGVKIYESTTEKSHEENMVYTEYFERAVSSVRYPVKFSMMVHVLDLSKHRLKWETKYAEAQLKLAREREKPEPDVLKVDRYEKEVSMAEGQIQRLVAGYKPMGAICYLMTTATGVSKDAAAAAVKAQANELKATISNALNVEVSYLQADEMLRCFDWEHIIPISGTKMESAVL